MRLNKTILLATLSCSFFIFSNVKAAGNILKTEVRGANTPVTSIQLKPTQVFTVNGFSVGHGDDVQALFYGPDGSLRNLTPIGWAVQGSLPEVVNTAGTGIPIRGPGLVNIDGQGLISYSVDKAK